MRPTNSRLETYLLTFHYASCNGLDNLHKTSTRPMIQYHKNTNLSRWTIKACVNT